MAEIDRLVIHPQVRKELEENTWERTNLYTLNTLLLRCESALGRNINSDDVYFGWEGLQLRNLPMEDITSIRRSLGIMKLTKDSDQFSLTLTSPQIDEYPKAGSNGRKYCILFKSDLPEGCEVEYEEKEVEINNVTLRDGKFFRTEKYVSKVNCGEPVLKSLEGSN